MSAIGVGEMLQRALSAPMILTGRDKAYDDRERRVKDLVGRGYTIKQISEMMGFNETTIGRALPAKGARSIKQSKPPVPPELMASFTRDYKQLKLMALRLTRRAEDAEDLVHSTIERAMTFADQYQPGTKPVAWMATIMRNTFMSSKTRAGSRLESTGHDDSTFDREVSGGQQERLELADALRIIDGLVPEHRDMILLEAVGGYTQEDLSVLLDLPMGTIKSRGYRARAKLKKQLEKMTNA